MQNEEDEDKNEGEKALVDHISGMAKEIPPNLGCGLPLSDGHHHSKFGYKADKYSQ